MTDRILTLCSSEFTKQMRELSDKIKKERGIRIYPSDLTHQLALDLREGKIKLNPRIIRFRKANYLQMGDRNKKKVR